MNFTHRSASHSTAHRASGACRKNGQARGSILVNAAIALSLVIITLIGTELGYLFYMKREFQKAADLAALAGAQQLSPLPATDMCKLAKDAATANATSNLPGVSLTLLECGKWAPGLPAGDHFLPSTDPKEHNALRVTITKEPPKLLPFFTGNRQISVKAVAALDAAVANFSVGSQLLRTNANSPLGKILQAVGVNPEVLTVLDSNGLAKIKVTPSGLLKDLGLGVVLDGGALTPTELAKLPQVTLSQILDLSLNAIGQDEALAVLVRALKEDLIDAHLGQVKLNLLGSDTGSGGILTLSTPNSTNEAALNTEIDLGMLLKTSIGIATAGRAVLIPGLKLGGLVDAQAGIVEPPSIGIGGIGTKAYNAQVRLYLNIDTDGLLGGLLSPIVTGLLGTRVHLPIYIDAINGNGELTGMDCLASPRKATVKVTSNILRACVGKVDDASVRFSTKNLCEDSLQKERLIQLLHLPVPAPAWIKIDAFSQQESVTLEVGQVVSTAPNTLKVGTTVANLIDELSKTLGQLLSLSPEAPADDKALALANAYLAATQKPNGFYDATAVINLLKNGNPATGSPSLGDWLRTVWVPDPLLGVIPVKKNLSVWQVLEDQTKPSGGLLGLIGLGPSCAGLLQALAWNSCVKGKVLDALNSAPAGVIDSAASQVPGSTSPGTGGATGLLSVLLSPVIALLQPLLDGIGGFLSNILTNVLGLELGRTDVKLNGLQCARSKLVY